MEYLKEPSVIIGGGNLAASLFMLTYFNGKISALEENNKELSNEVKRLTEIVSGLVSSQGRHSQLLEKHHNLIVKNSEVIDSIKPKKSSKPREFEMAKMMELLSQSLQEQEKEPDSDEEVKKKKPKKSKKIVEESDEESEEIIVKKKPSKKVIPDPESDTDTDTEEEIPIKKVTRKIKPEITEEIPRKSSKKLPTSNKESESLALDAIF